MFCKILLICTGKTLKKEKTSPNTAITISAVVIAIVVTLAIIGFACRMHIKNKREEKKLYKEILVKTGLNAGNLQRKSLRKRYVNSIRCSCFNYFELVTKKPGNLKYL